jgi:hypothetical protein
MDIRRSAWHAAANIGGHVSASSRIQLRGQRRHHRRSPPDGRWASGRRQIIEQVIFRLKDLFALKRHGSKTLGGLLARLAAKVAAYLCGQRLNSLLSRSLRHLADLLD